MNKAAIYIISFYQLFLSPILHMLAGVSSGCRYSISCSEFAKKTINERGLIIALPRIAGRIFSCQPLFNKGARA